MRTRICFFALFTAIIAFPITDASAGNEVYRWVDEDGVVHFENLAPQQGDAEKITIKSNRNTNYQPGMDTVPEKTDEEIDTDASFAQQRRDERAMKRQEAAEKGKLTAATCEQSRIVVAKLEPMTRVLVEQEDGTVVRMDDNDRLERLREEKAYIAEKCN